MLPYGGATSVRRRTCMPSCACASPRPREVIGSEAGNQAVSLGGSPISGHDNDSHVADRKPSSARLWPNFMRASSMHPSGHDRHLFRPVMRLSSKCASSRLRSAAPDGRPETRLDACWALTACYETLTTRCVTRRVRSSRFGHDDAAAARELRIACHPHACSDGTTSLYRAPPSPCLALGASVESCSHLNVLGSDVRCVAVLRHR